MALASKRSIMTLYSGSSDIESHRTRIVLAEKGVLVDVIEVERHENLEDFRELNPYNTVPTLVDRDLVLYSSQIIMEYLDERFPHPPLLPVYPIARAKSRLMIFRIEHDWYSLVNVIQKGSEKKAEKARKDLLEGLVAIAPVFADSPYFLSEEFSMVDCCIIPILWRLPELGIEIPKQGKAILDYAERIFERDSFQASLTETEREIRLDLE
jgi:stringent starvation protein A